MIDEQVPERVRDDAVLEAMTERLALTRAAESCSSAACSSCRVCTSEVCSPASRMKTFCSSSVYFCFFYEWMQEDAEDAIIQREIQTGRRYFTRTLECVWSLKNKRQFHTQSFRFMRTCSRVSSSASASRREQGSTSSNRHSL